MSADNWNTATKPAEQWQGDPIPIDVAERFFNAAEYPSAVNGIRWRDGKRPLVEWSYSVGRSWHGG